MQEHVFFLYNKDCLMWQMCLPADDPKKEGQRLLELYNELNEWPDDEKARTVQHCTLAKWVECLKTRGEEYKADRS